MTFKRQKLIDGAKTVAESGMINSDALEADLI